jgi:hypothetical protein
MKFYKMITARTLSILIVSGLLVTSCKKDSLTVPKTNAITPAEGAGNTVLTLTGSGLANIRSIVFDLGNVAAGVNPTLNTDNALIFRVPAGANVGDQHIVLTNAAGYQFSVPFTVLAVPSITSAFPQEWEAGSNVTINGNYLEAVDAVSLEGTSLTATVVSAEATKLVITMPAADVKTAKLIIHNNAGSTTTSFALTNMDKTFKFFTEDFASGIQNWSWCAASGSTNYAVAGTHSLQAVYGADGWQGLSFHYDFDIVFNNYQALSFWAKGGTQDNDVDVKPDGVSSGTAVAKTITIPAGVWTHFTIPVSGNFDGVTGTRLNFQIHGPTGITETIYFDDIYMTQ